MSRGERGESLVPEQDLGTFSKRSRWPRYLGIGLVRARLSGRFVRQSGWYREEFAPEASDASGAFPYFRTFTEKESEKEYEENHLCGYDAFAECKKAVL